MQCTQCDTVYNKNNLTVRPHGHKLEPTLVHTAINAIFYSNIPGEEHQLTNINKENMQRKESLPTKLLEIIAIRNGEEVES